jgi:hypothetical protein
MSKEILNNIPLEKLCIFHYKNRAYLENKSKWTAKEKDKLKTVISLTLLNLAVFIFGLWSLIYLFDLIKEYLIVDLIYIFVFFGLLAFNIIELVEYMNAKDLRKKGDLLIGRVTNCKFFEDSDSPTIILSYCFVKPSGETINFTTGHIKDCGFYYIHKQIKFFSFDWLKREKKPKPEDFVIVLFLDKSKSSLNTDLFDVL